MKVIDIDFYFIIGFVEYKIGLSKNVWHEILDLLSVLCDGLHMTSDQNTLICPRNHIYLNIQGAAIELTPSTIV